MALTRCEWCQQEVPASRFCIRCGHQLGASTHPRGLSGVARGASGVFGAAKPAERPSSLSGVRRAFVAAPHESVLRPSIVSTIFLQLPRPSMAAFRASLALGLATVLALGAFKLYPAGLVAGAILLPMLALIYFYDVNIYGEQPLTVLAATMLWGAATGVGIAFAAKAMSPTGADVFVSSSGSIALWRGVVIPLVSVALILAGPLFLFRFPRFNTAIDGASFAAASAVSFTGAEVIVQAVAAFGAGLRPAGAVLPWLVKLMTISLALPVLTMTAIGAAAGAIWLRYRAPIRDRRALGVLGGPALALPLAIALVVAGSLVQVAFAIGVALAVIAALAVVSVLWLRRVVQVGVLEEALEIESAPTIACANCGHSTRMGSFCEHCGIALAALPRSRSGIHAAPVSPSGKPAT